MSGFFGVVSQHDCVVDLYYGTDYHCHLGTRRGGIAVTIGEQQIFRKIHDISNAQFRSKFDDEIQCIHGCSGLGVISDSEDQPLIITSAFGTFAIVTVGKINNLNQLIAAAFADGCSHLSESGDGEPNPTEVVAMLIAHKGSVVEGIKYAQDIIDGSASILVLLGNKIYAARDKYGRTPVIIGRKTGTFAVTMESSAFPNLGYDVYRELGPGEIVELSADSVKILEQPGKTMKFCSFFWVYYGYPSSSYEGINTETSRYRNGAILANEDAEILNDIDSICGIPDSGVAHAIGYSNASHKPYQRAFVKYTPTWQRSFMPQDQRIRDQIAHKKLIPVREQIEGKKLMFCDDSIVRGTQLKDTVSLLYRLGAKEVHMRSACPPLLFGCKFLNFSRSRSELDLAARRAILKLEGDITPEIIDQYLVYNSPKYLAMVDEIRKMLDLTSLKFQSLESLVAAIGLPQEQLCTYCWNGCDVKEK